MHPQTQRWRAIDLHKVNRLIAIALGVEVPTPGESVGTESVEAASLEAFRMMRCYGTTFTCLRLEPIERAVEPAQPGEDEERVERRQVHKETSPASATSGASACEMPFGKHRGRTLSDIARTDPGYLRWLATDCTIRDPEFAGAVAAVYAAQPSSTETS